MMPALNGLVLLVLAPVARRTSAEHTPTPNKASKTPRHAITPLRMISYSCSPQSVEVMYAQRLMAQRLLEDPGLRKKVQCRLLGSARKSRTGKLANTSLVMCLPTPPSLTLMTMILPSLLSRTCSCAPWRRPRMARRHWRWPRAFATNGTKTPSVVESGKQKSLLSMPGS